MIVQEKVWKVELDQDVVWDTCMKACRGLCCTGGLGCFVGRRLDGLSSNRELGVKRRAAAAKAYAQMPPI